MSDENTGHEAHSGTDEAGGSTQYKPKHFDEQPRAGENTSPGSDSDAINTRTAADLETVFDVPIKVTAILGRVTLPVGDLLKLETGSILELDRKVGEAIDILVNDKLIARGEVVMVENKLGITMTEIVAAD